MPDGKGKAKVNAFAGVDIGSLTAKTVILDGNSAILSAVVIQHGIVDEAAARESYEKALTGADLERKDIAFTVSTGYGRYLSGFGDKEKTEISCHGRGAHFLHPGVRTVIDIGGQDSKVISLDGEGRIVNFAMNDKCAAGTGRFLEIMATALNVELEMMGEQSLKSRSPAHVSSICAVFAESEVISLMAKGQDKTDVMAGIHDAIARRMFSLVKSVGINPPVLMSGGVAKNIGVVRHLEKVIGEQVIVPDDPQIVGAIGAALCARDEAL